MDAAALGAAKHERGERFGVRLGAELREGAVVTGRQNPPGGLAFRTVLADQERDFAVGAVEAQPQHSTFASSRRLGWRLEIGPSRLGEVDEDPGALLEREHEVLPPPADASQGLSDQRVGGRHDRLEPGEAQRLPSGQAPARQGHLQALGQRLHLRELGHPPSLARPTGAAPRSGSAASPDARAACPCAAGSSAAAPGGPRT